MLTDDIHHKLGTSQSLSSIQSKDQERQELQQLVDNFIARGGKIDEIPPSQWNVEALSYNRQGPLNPQKKVKRWNNAGLAKNYRA